jgi:photosystem I subunit 11
MFNQYTDLRQMKLMQYHGKKGVDGMFVGQEYTEQGNFKHGLYQVSGRVAHTAMEIIRAKPTSGLKATRVDLQITVLYSSAMPIFRALWANRATLKGKQGNKLRYKTIEGDDGLNTIYVGSRVSEVAAYRKGLSPILRGLEIGMAHGYFLIGPWVKLGPLRDSAHANLGGLISGIALILIATICLSAYGLVSYQGESQPGADYLKTSEGWSQFAGGFFVGAMGAAFVAYFLLDNFTVVDSIFRGLFN